MIAPMIALINVTSPLIVFLIAPLNTPLIVLHIAFMIAPLIALMIAFINYVSASLIVFLILSPLLSSWFCMRWSKVSSSVIS